MGYYIRVLATDETPLPGDELRGCLPDKPSCELDFETKDEAGWSQLLLRHVGGPAIAVIERNPVLPGPLGEEEIGEFVDDAKSGMPDSAARWLSQYLPRVKVIYAVQLLSGTDVDDGWSAVHALRGYIWRKRGGIFQADGGGFSNEDGYHILWQFSDHVAGNWNMAVLDEAERWIRFEMDLGNREQRAAFLDGKLPDQAKLLLIRPNPSSCLQ